MDLEFQCCLCGKAIAGHESGGHDLDPCAVLVIGNWRQSSEHHVERQYFCHIECFKRIVGHHAPIDLEEMAAEIV